MMLYLCFFVSSSDHAAQTRQVKCFIMIHSTTFCGDTVQRNNKPVHHMFMYGRGTSFRFCLSISVGPGIPSESPVRHYVSQPGVPARSHPCLFWTWSWETITAAEVSPSWGSVNLTHDFAYDDFPRRVAKPSSSSSRSKSQSLTNSFTETLRGSLTDDEAKAETIRSLRQSFASLFSD